MAVDQDRAKSIFLNATELASAAERDAYLAAQCGSDEALHREVTDLLSHHARARGFLESATAALVALADDAPVAERPGAAVGPYKLIEPIGEGGMGTVWRAQQTEPVKRLVAVKLIKAGMDSKQVIARFEAERQALALMDHANIAHVLDAGTTGAGRPYFVMDLVKGVPITRHCDEHRLTLRRRLELFLPVCRAVEHAHQKGIIHRDLKPSNVLVALYDGKAVPKVIDFGVAKAAGQALTDETLVTGFGAIIGTPEYMAPEQAEVNQPDVDTRSDIYSLGVLLYELLAGSPPFNRRELETVGMAELLRVIREREPPKPSAKLSTAGGLPTLAANRGTEPAKLAKLVRGELDWIVMKALEKDRGRRYQTANALALDVQRYLADEPVLACPPSAGYRLWKFTRRNRTGLAVAGLILFFLVLLGSVAGWAWRDRAARAAERADRLERAVERVELLQGEGKRREALEALEAAQLLAREAEPAPPLAGRLESLQLLLDAEGRDEAFVEQFEAIRREVQTELDVQQNRFLGENAYPRLCAALGHYGIAVGVTPPAAAVTHIQTRPVAVQTVVLAALDECLRYVPGKDGDAREWLFAVLRQADRDPWRDKVRWAWTQPAVLEALAKDVDVRQQPPSFLLLVVRALPTKSPDRLDLARRVQFAYPGDFWANQQLGSDLDRTGNSAEAVRYYTAALSLRPDNSGVLHSRGKALLDAGELPAAIADLQRAVALEPRYAAAHYTLGRALLAQRRPDDAIAACKAAIDIDPKLAAAHIYLGRALQTQRKLDDAIACFRKAMELDPDAIFLHHELGNALRQQGRLDDAIASYQKAIEINPTNAPVHIALGDALIQQKKLDEGIAMYKKAIELNPKVVKAHHELGNALRQQGRLDDAIASYRQAIALTPDYTPALINLGRVLRQQGKLDEAIAAYQKALAIVPKYAAGHNEFAWLLATCPDAKFRDPSLALGLAKKAVELAPKNPGYLNTLGLAQYRAGDWQAAIATLDKAMGLREGGDSFDWFFLAMAHWRLGEKDRARAWYDRAVEWMDRHQPTNEELRRFRAESAELLGLSEKK
jgi:tetratricopeptide (TPR) repeat protein/serine/threonine protein kinase